MDPGPLPPHERPWRHPSELGPPQHEPAGGGAKVLIVTTATLSLLLVGLLVVAMTPASSGSDADGVTTIVAVRVDTVAVVRLDEPAQPPVVAPVGEHGLALTTMSAIGPSTGGDAVPVRLPTGQVVDAAVVALDADRGLAVVALPDGVTTETFVVADDEPAPLAPDDTVLVHGEEPQVMSLEALRTAAVDEGTPVSDGAGNLIGVCTIGEHETMLMAADAAAIDVGVAPTTASPVPTTESTPTTPDDTVQPDLAPDPSVTPTDATDATASGSD